MDFRSLVAGPAQAGHQSLVSKPGIGLAAGAGASPTCDAPGGGGDDFASLVALALGQLGAGGAGEGSAAGAARSENVSANAEDADAVAEDAEASPLDTPVDAVTLSVLIALATPLPVPVAVLQPDMAPPSDTAGPAGQARADLAAIDSPVAGTFVSAAAAPVTGAPSSTTAVPAGSTDFQDVLGAASTTPETAVAAPAAPPAATSAVTPATTSAPTAGLPSAPPAVADATRAPLAQRPAVAPAPVPTPTPTPAPAPAGAAAPASQTGGPRTTAQASSDPVRQALAALAAEPAITPSTPQAQQAATTATAAALHVAAQAAPVSAEAGSAGPETRTSAAMRADSPAFAPVVAVAASDAGSTGDSSSGGSDDASATALFRGVDARLEASVIAAAQTATATISPDALVSSALAAVPGLGFGSGADATLRAIDLPAAARFGQTLSSLDPDVSNLQAMVRTVRLFTAGSGATEARLTLEPEHLGPVALTVRIEHGAVSAHFRAETPAAHRWIETHQQELRAGLREQGLEVKEVVVTTDPDGRRERQQDAKPSRPKQRRQTADSPRFEVLV